MLQRIRKSWQINGSALLINIVEVGREYAGGKISNMSNKKRAELKKDKSKTPDAKTEMAGLVFVPLDIRPAAERDRRE